MSKKLIQDFYKSDALINPEIMDQFLHSDILLDWNSSTGFKQLNREQLLALTAELSKAYVRSKARISHIVKEGNLVSVRYTHCIKTIENPREEMVLAHFMVIWEIKDDKLYRGFQISQLP
ncbi:MAG: nuclear transport factor 2 family protein [Bacteroidetes bacterium]|nr:nuclear transport factor 2 family protein [Bacteroidota bacterium]